ncbi:hypothetical protein [Streptomyces albidoflavus]|uniref:hypothetical protein n=1 Tax=Streptomyces albidoflavus TaxID=1886 RepID=UPI001021FC0A|nr:hypothetical protein [Streptomyces albidoflavus]RZF02821.1 hypothetical protein C0R05_31905 [Streptomyces albidoflavus]
MSMLDQYHETWWLPGGRLAACSIAKVYPLDSNMLADLYADQCGSQRLPNPLRTDERGVLHFWAMPGKYWVHIDGRTYPITVGEQGCVTPTDLDQKLAEHVQADDPHGNRAAANAALLHHSSCTKGVHGIIDTALLETKDGAQRRANEAVEQAMQMVRQAVDCHAAQTKNVHGICDTAALETVNGAQAKANQAVAAAQLVAEESARSAVREELDGLQLPDPENLETRDGAQAKANAARDAAIEAVTRYAAEGDATLARRIEALEDEDGGGGAWETPAGAQDKADEARGAAEETAQRLVDEHSTKTTDVHGIADTTALATSDQVEAGDAALQEQIDALKESGGGGEPAPGGVTEEQAKALADAARDEAVATAADALKAHVDACHTLEVDAASEGVVAEEGWAVDLVERRSLGGSHTAFIRLKRTGDGIQSKDETFVNADGLHEEGNLVPDLLIAKVGEKWRPPQTYLTSAHTSYGSGSVRVHPTGEVYLLDWARNNVLQTNHTLRFEYEWLTKSPCEESSAEGDGGGSGGGGTGEVEEAPAAEVTREALSDELSRLVASYPSAYSVSTRETPTAKAASVRWVAWPVEGQKKAVAGDPAVGLSVTLRVPPSLKLRVATSMRASNKVAELSQAHQAVEVWKGETVVLAAGDTPSMTASFVRLNETDSVSRCFHVDFSQVGDGQVQAGDEVTLRVVNQTTLGEVLLLERDVAAESLLA